MKKVVPKLTIAIPTYQRPKYLIQAISSALIQTKYEFPYEVIVVNNDPNSDIDSLQKKYCDYGNIRFYKNERNLGMVGNMNRCVSLARGEYIAFLHDDDLLLPNYLSEIKDIIYAGDVGCVVPARFLLFDDSCVERLAISEKRKMFKQFLSAVMLPRYLIRHRLTPIKVRDNIFAWQNCYCAPSCGTLFRIKALKNVGMFSTESTYSWDFLTFLALNEKETIQILHRPVAVYRMTTGASIRSEVQFDFYQTNEMIMRHFPADSKEWRFIHQYWDEIRWLNYMYLSEEAKDCVVRNVEDAVINCPSKLRFLVFMLKRFLYYSYHNLDVQKTLPSYRKRSLLQMGIYEE